LRQDFGRIRREMGRQPMVATIHSIGEGRPAEVPLSDRGKSGAGSSRSWIAFGEKLMPPVSRQLGCAR
jgi:hypothetical protein